MALDDPTLLVNVLTRDLRAMTTERDELLRQLSNFQAPSTSHLTSRVQELESTTTSLQCHLLETESELKQARETAYERLNENVELRNRRARVKRDLQTTSSKLAEAERMIKEMEVGHEERVKELEKTILATRDELAGERRKNAGLKDLVGRITSQRDDALSKLPQNQRPPIVESTSMLVSPPRRPTFSPGRHVDEFGRAAPGSPSRSPTKQASMRKHAELSDALMTPHERNTFETIDMVIQSPPRPNTTTRPPSSPSGFSDYSMMEEDFADFKSRSRRLNNLKKLPTIEVPEDAMAYPVCPPNDDLNTKLKILSKSHIFNAPYLLDSSQIEFANPTRQHGYILRPSLVLDPSHNRWSPYTLDAFEPEFPAIFELFVGSARKGWFYKGTYRRMDGAGSAAAELGNLSVGEWEDLDSATKTRLLDQVYRLCASRPSLRNPFESGDVLAQCIGLQCIGFNASLHHALEHFDYHTQSRSVTVASRSFPTNGFNTPTTRTACPTTGFSTPTAAFTRTNTPTIATPPLERPKSGWDPISPAEAAGAAEEFGWQGGAKAFMKRLSNTWSGHKRIRSLDVGQSEDESDGGVVGVGKRIKLGSRASSRLRFGGNGL
ncbi:hypothetical protein FRB90_002397 [Tulasnella sp. 427]|nr:hypothetical protein FRB90_002397 [Tulasnella sp. 427]